MRIPNFINQRGNLIEKRRRRKKRKKKKKKEMLLILAGECKIFIK